MLNYAIIQMKRQQEKIVKKGEFITSKKVLCESWGWSNTKLNNYFNVLQKQQMITLKKHTKNIVVKVLNYAKYQQFVKLQNTQITYEKHSENTQTTMLTMITRERQKKTNKQTLNI